MADIIYKVTQDDPNSIQGFEQFSEADKNLIGTFEVNNLFDPSKHTSEVHIYSLVDDLIESHYDYSNYKQLGNAQSAGKVGASVLTIDPIADSKLYGYDNGGIKLLYHFINDLYSKDKTSTEFYIDSISEDRTELRLGCLALTTEDIIQYTDSVKNSIQNTSYFNEFRLNFKNNDLFIGINIDTVDYNGGKAVVVKLYEPLPTGYNEKSTLNIVEIVSDSVAYEVDSDIILEQTTQPTLKPANFNLDITDEHVVPSQYYTYEELFSYPINNSNSQIYSMISEKGAEISVDYSDFSNFVHFSSAYERLINFKYKLDLITSYSSSIASASNATTGLQGVSGSKVYYENLITGIVNNFDHYERFLYYESGSNSWPKSNNTKPYINKNSTSTEAINWYTQKITTANSYDNTNYSSIIYTVPSYLRDDQNNENYMTFLYMVGQHFDNLWLYSKAVTDKYDADNRIGHGISKDLVAEALKNFGVKLYTSNKSIEDLFTAFIGQSYQSGSEVINHYITGSLTGSNTPIQPVSYDDYNKEVQKRIYHNLPHLLKTKGTERGLRALINCFGISSDILKVKQYGGRNINERPFFGDYQPYTSSLSKIRLDNTGSLISGSTLSQYTSIIKREDTYTDDLHVIEVGFSPVDNIDKYILTNITASFDIDDYIGDPGDLTSGSYTGLNQVATTLLSGSLGTDSHYDLQDYVRLIKFYDNTIFKMIKDFIPGRAVADTGVIIKPNLLNRSKAKSVIVTGSRPEVSGSIDTAFIDGNNAGAFFTSAGQSSTSYYDTIQTPDGLTNPLFLHNQEQPRYNGEFSGSGLTVTNGNLTVNNPYTVSIVGAHAYNVAFISASNEVCLLNTSSIRYITSSTYVYQASDFFGFAPSNAIYSASDDITSPVYTQITFPHAFSGYGQYGDFYLWAQNPNYTLGECTQSMQLRYGVCELSVNTSNALPYVQKDVVPNPPITSWFSSNPNQGTGTAGALALQYTASWNDGTQHTVGITNPSTYNFPQTLGTSVTITLVDPNLGNICNTSYTTIVGATGIGVISPIPEFTYSGYTPHGTSHQGNWSDPTTQYSFLGTSIYGGFGNPTLKRGIQGYFTPFATPTPGTLPGGSTTCYTVYTLYNVHNAATGCPWYLSKETPITNVSSLTPYTITTNGDPEYIGQMSEAQHPPFGFFSATNAANRTAPFLLTLITDFKEFLSGNEPVNRDPHDLVRAYVIHAYPSGAPTLYTQAVVYGYKSTLSPAEGTGTYTTYTDTWILVDWPYHTQGFPLSAGQTSYNAPGTGSIPAGYGPWVKVPVRSFTNTPSPN